MYSVRGINSDSCLGSRVNKGQGEIFVPVKAAVGWTGRRGYVDITRGIYTWITHVDYTRGSPW